MRNGECDIIICVVSLRCSHVAVANDKAMITKNKWDADKVFGEYNKGYLEKKYIEWIKKYVGYGKSTLERKGMKYHLL